MTTAISGAQALIARLEALGASHVVGLPGQHALPLFDALMDSHLHYLGARVENNAGFMADGVCRVTGNPTPLLLSAGPGALTSLAAVQEAAEANSPVVVVCAQVPLAGLGPGRQGFLHELDDQSAAFAPIVKGVWSPRSAEEIVPAIDQAWTLANTIPRGPVYLEIPYDVQTAPVSADAPRGEVPVEHCDVPVDLSQALSLLVGAEKPRILAGGGVVRSDASAALRAFAAQLAAPVVTTPAGRQAVPEDFSLSAHGWIEDIATTEFLEEADVLIVVGSGMGELNTNYFTMQKPPHVLHVDADQRMLDEVGASVTLRGDARAILTQLTAELPPATAHRMERAQADISHLLTMVSQRLEPQNLASEMTLLSDIREAIPAEVPTFWDMTILAYWAWSAWDAKGGAFETSQCGGLGFAFPAALGASFALGSQMPGSGHRTVAVSGDGGALYSLVELAQAVAEQVDVTWVIIDDGGYGVLRGYLEGAYGRHSGTDLVQPDFVALARSFGVPARSVKPTQVGRALADSFSQEGPSVIVVPTTLNLFAASHGVRLAAQNNHRQ